MIDSSKLTNEELRLAIAEIVAKRSEWIVCRDDWSFRISVSVVGPGDATTALRFVEYIPNYPSDSNAALELPLKTNDEKRKFAIELAKIVVLDVNIGIAGIVWMARFATARQHCEAWLTTRMKWGE